MYNIRFGEKQAVTNKMISAKYVLLYNETIGIPFFLKITGNNPQVYTKNDLPVGYPNPTASNYLVYEVEKDNVEELDALIESNSIISRLKEDKNSFLPFAVSFETLLLSMKDI